VFVYICGFMCLCEEYMCIFMLTKCLYIHKVCVHTCVVYLCEPCMTAHMHAARDCVCVRTV